MSFSSFPTMRSILDYVLDEVIGQGADTVVYRARRLPGGRARNGYDCAL